MKHNWINGAKRIIALMLLANLLFINWHPIGLGAGSGVSLFGERVVGENAD